MEPDQHKIVDAPRVAINETLRQLVISHDRELNEMFEAWKLRAVNPAMQEHAVIGVHRVLALLQPVAGRMN